MSDSSKPCCSNPKQVLWTLLIFALFGFLALILSGQLGAKNPENRAYMGEFTEEATKLRWDNFKEVKEAQNALVDPAKVKSALEAIAKSAPKPAPTDLVVPGSPTFLKQMEQQAAPAPAAPGAAPGAAPAPAAPAPAATTTPAPAPAPSQPAAPAPAAPAPAPAAK
jgi:2-oxoglutarate dehydrogenase E2 component (dihydrolipoamide succinyltransferase)